MKTIKLNKNKRSTSNLYFESNGHLLKSKSSQGEVITTVLLILIGIVAVALVSTYVIKMVQDYLKPTDCFKTNGQLILGTDEQYNYFDVNANEAHFTITRGEKDFNLTGIVVIYGDSASTTKLNIVPATLAPAKLKMASGTGIVLPGTQETKAYIITDANAGTITKIGIAPVLASTGECKEVDSKEIVAVA